MKKISKYNFIGKIALEYRLSLNSLCKVLGKEPNEELKIELYNAILSTVSSHNPMYDAYKFLFNYETLNESKEVVKYTILNYSAFVNRYNAAKRNNDSEELLNITNELNEVDLKFKKLINRKVNYDLTTEDYLVVSKYRLKYAFSRYKVADILNISRDTLTDKEKKIEDPILRKKLNLLDEFYKDIIGLKGKKYK